MTTSPPHYETLVNQVMQALENQDYATIKQCCHQLLSHFPSQDSSVHRLFAAACYQTHDYAQAITLLNQAIELEAIAPNYFNLALAHEALNHTDEAINAYLKFIEQEPNYADAYNNLGNVYAKHYQIEQAKHCYQQALSLNPQHALVHKNLGTLLTKTNELALAEQHLKQAVVLLPSFQEAWNELGLLYEKNNQPEQAIDAFKQAGALSAWQRLLRKTIQWAALPPVDEAVLQAIREGKRGIEPLSVINIPHLTPALHKQTAKQFAEYCYNLPNTPLYSPRTTSPKKLKIGYLSGNFYDHVVMRLLMGVLEHHDTTAFDFYLYSYSPKREDAYTKRLAHLGYPLKSITTLTDQQAAKLIAQDKVDILIDLQGYTEGARQQINALRPAPVIVNWLGYAGTLGHTQLADCLIGDPVATPANTADDYSETLALLPHCYLPTDSSKTITQTLSRQAAGLPEKGFVFCSFNQWMKVNPDTFDLWCTILSKAPESLLWLPDPNDQTISQRLMTELTQRGISADRLIFAPRTATEQEHLTRLQLADLALDTFPYNSHATACDALLAGVPLISKKGDLFASRVGASVLSACSLSELVVKNDNAYVALAVRLATETHYYQHIKQVLRKQKATAPLFNTHQFTKQLEQLYLAIWQHHCSNSAAKVVTL